MQKEDVFRRDFIMLNCSTERGAERQRKIEYGLLELMSKYPYEKITVSLLVEHLKMPRKTFYRYFESKDEALNALLEQMLRDYEKTVVVNAPYSSRKELECYFQYWENQKELLDALARNDLGGLLTDHAIQKALNEQGSWYNLLCIETSSETDALVFVVSGIYSLMMNWYKTGCKRTPKQMADISIQLLIQPLFREI